MMVLVIGGGRSGDRVVRERNEIKFVRFETKFYNVV